MCKCTPEIRTPWCGKPGCEMPKQPTVTEKKCPGSARAMAEEVWAEEVLQPLYDRIRALEAEVEHLTRALDEERRAADRALSEMARENR